MGLGIIIGVKMFELSTRKVDEWELIKQGNIATTPSSLAPDPTV